MQAPSIHESHPAPRMLHSRGQFPHPFSGNQHYEELASGDNYSSVAANSRGADGLGAAQVVHIQARAPKWIARAWHCHIRKIRAGRTAANHRPVVFDAEQPRGECKEEENGQAEWHRQHFYIINAKFK